jgi:hypothetical protein
LAQGSVSITTNGTISFFVQPNGYSKIGVRDGNTGNYCSFHLSGAGSILQNSGFTTPAITYDSVSDLYYITVSLTASSVNPQLYILDPSYTTGSITGSWIGDNSSGILLYYFQVESGLFATTPIITAGSALTRLADIFSINNLFTNGLVTSAGGTWFFELRNNIVYTRDSATRLGIGDTVGLATNSIFLIPNGTGRYFIFKSLAGAASPLFETTTTVVKVAVKWDGANLDLFVNGNKVNLTSGQRTFNAVNLGNLINTGNGTPTNMAEMMLAATPLSDTQCIALTTL